MPWFLYPWKKAPGTHWIREWVGCRADLDTMAKKKEHHCPLQEINPSHPAHSQIFIVNELL